MEIVEKKEKDLIAMLENTLSSKLVIAIASRALFDLNASHQIFESEGTDAYSQYQIAHEDVILEEGVAFGLVKKLLNLLHPETQERLVEVILLSRNSADTGLRVFNSIQHYELPISRAVFTSGQSPYQYIRAFGAHLFLSANPEDVAWALQAGCAAATILPGNKLANLSDQVRIAFDGDAVLFSPEAERVFQLQGLEAFSAQEKQSALQPLGEGPFKGFLAALHRLQSLFTAENCPIRTALVTARGAPNHERVIRTLRQWNVRIDEALFLSGLDKGEFLHAFGADFFFDDQQRNCLQSSLHVATGHVPVV